MIIPFCIIFGIAFIIFGRGNRSATFGNIPTLLGVALCVIAVIGIVFPESLNATAPTVTPTATPVPVENQTPISSNSVPGNSIGAEKIGVAYFDSFNCNMMTITEPNWFNSSLYKFYQVREDGGLEEMSIRTENVTLYPTLESGERPYLEVVGTTLSPKYNLYYDKNIKR